jgi:hypothetical protein
MPRPHLRLTFSARRRQRLLAAAALVVGVAVVIVLVVDTGSPSSPAGSATAATAAGATAVQRRNLVATDTESGTLSYSNPQTVYNRLSGTITWLPRIGQVIKPGGTLFTIDGKPVLLMNGRTPAYRDLTPAVSAGADVLELNRNLVRLGFNSGGITVDDVWQPGTTLGIDLLQESLGEPATGSLALGHVVFLPGAQLVSTVGGTLGSTGGGGATGGTGGATGASTVVSSPRPEFVSLATTVPTTSTTTSTTPTTTTPAPAGAHPAPTGGKPHKKTGGTHRPPAPTSAASGQTLAALSALLKAESAQLKAAAAQLRAERGSSPSGASNAGGGAPSSSTPSSSTPPSSTGSGNSGGGGTAAPILQTTSTRLVVTVDLSASSQSEAVVGGHVTVEMPNATTVGGRITAVSSVAQSSSSGNGSGSGAGSGSGGSGGGGSGGGGGSTGSSSSTVPVTIALNRHHAGAGLDQAAVSVNFVQQRATNVLSVPVTALLATSGGNYALQEAGAPHHLIPVTTGLFAAGYVQVSGRGIYPGLQVTDSQG